MNDLSIQELSVDPGDLIRDREKVIELWKDGLNHENPGKSYDWLFVSNPASKGSIFLLNIIDEQPDNVEPITIGVIGTSPRNLKINGKPIRATLFSDFVVVPKYRSLGPALKLVKESVAQMRGEGVTLFGFPNRKATPVLRRAGFKVIGDFARYAKVIRTRDKLVEKIPSSLVPFAGFFLDILLWMDDFFTALSSRRTMLGTCQWVDSFDKSFDELAENSTFGDICSHRSEQFLNWRFFEGPSSNYKIFKAFMPDGNERLAGYAVCRCADGVVFIDDFYARDGEETAQAVFSKLILEIRTFPASAVSIEVIAPPAFMRLLKRFRFQKRELRQLYMASDVDAINEQEGNGDRFYLTSCDEDQ